MKNRAIQKLIFIYNADSGLRNMVMDSVHKIFSPSTYQCNLCDITYGAFTENSIWKKFRKETNLQMQFLHKDEFTKTYRSKFGHKFTFPIVLAETQNGLEIFVKTEELNEMNTTEGLISMVKTRV